MNELSCLHGSDRGIVCDDVSERSDAGEKIGQELRSEKRQIAFTNTAPTFSKR